MINETYNGWTNFSTWRIALELFDGWDTEGTEVTPEELQDIAEDYIEFSSSEGIVRNYAMAFMNDVNWHEIANNLNETEETHIKLNGAIGGAL